MSYEYLDASRASDPHALPEVEVWEAIGEYFSCSCGCDYPALRDADHRFCEACQEEHDTPADGFYWAFLDGGLDCFSSEPDGPYPTKTAACTAAREAAGLEVK